MVGSIIDKYDTIMRAFQICDRVTLDYQSTLLEKQKIDLRGMEK
jgi:hypothetical protein